MALSIQSLNVAYGRKKIIDEMSLPTIEPGSLVAVLGANAVGKSTLLKAIAGLIKYKGDVMLDEKPLASLSQQERIQTIGYLPQALPQTSTLVAFELVYSACRAVAGWGSLQEKKKIQQRVERIFNRLGIRHLALKKMREMSGGQRQMVGLAQVLIRQPSLLLLDEPTSALDLHWQLSVLQIIREEAEENNAIAIVASHDLNLALRFCDQLLLLSPDGELAMGTSIDILTPAYLRKAYSIEARIESCSKGYPIVLADQALGKSRLL